jgi:hypothetical protein
VNRRRNASATTPRCLYVANLTLRFDAPAIVNVTYAAAGHRPLWAEGRALTLPTGDILVVLARLGAPLLDRGVRDVGRARVVLAMPSVGVLAMP